MTAIIGILNTSAVAIAADSAVTVGSGTSSKVYNHANKIFNLANGKPTGIMIYNSAEFAGVPWETIIKEYKRNSKSKGFKSTKNYYQDFIKFLKSFKVKHKLNNEGQVLFDISTEVINILDKEIEYAIEERFPDKKVWNNLAVKERISFFRTELIRILNSTIKGANTNQNVKTHSQDTVQKLDKKFRPALKKIAEEYLFNYNLNPNKKLS